MRQSKKSRWVPVVLIVVAVMFFGAMGFLFLVGLGMMVGGVEFAVGERIAVINVEGVILDGDSFDSFLGSVAGSKTIAKLLKQAKKDDDIKAVVLRINSPGGSAAASQEIYSAIREFKKSKKPIAVSMGDLAASGGYYISAAADKVFANPATLTGSIGVIMQWLNISEFLAEHGVKEETIKSGQHKDIANPFGETDPEERKLLKQMIDDVYNQFVEDVARGRKLTKAQVKRVADGRVLTGNQAYKHRLVDALGGFEDAIEWAAKKAGIRGEPKVVELGKKSPFESLLEQKFSLPRLPPFIPLLLHMDARLGFPWVMASPKELARKVR